MQRPPVRISTRLGRYRAVNGAPPKQIVETMRYVYKHIRMASVLVAQTTVWTLILLQDHPIQSPSVHYVAANNEY